MTLRGSLNWITKMITFHLFGPGHGLTQQSQSLESLPYWLRVRVRERESTGVGEWGGYRHVTSHSLFALLSADQTARTDCVFAVLCEVASVVNVIKSSVHLCGWGLTTQSQHVGFLYSPVMTNRQRFFKHLHSGHKADAFYPKRLTISTFVQRKRNKKILLSVQ